MAKVTLYSVVSTTKNFTTVEVTTDILAEAPSIAASQVVSPYPEEHYEEDEDGNMTSEGVGRLLNEWIDLGGCEFPLEVDYSLEGGLLITKHEVEI